MESTRAQIGMIVGLWGLLLILGAVPSMTSFSTPPTEVRRPASTENPGEAPRLLFITLDGVRVDEAADCTDVVDLAKSNCSFPILWSKIRSGDFSAYPMKVGNSRNLSLPGYQTIYSGSAQDATCITNENCTRVPIETWLENIRDTAALKISDVTVIASWNKMPLAVQKNPGHLWVNAGRGKMTDPRSDEVPASLIRENSDQSTYPPEWENARADEYTYRYAEWYLTEIRPRVLVMGLLDSDELAHAGRYKDYRKQLRTYDRYIGRLMNLLRERGLLQNTIVVVTTDHGRGKGYYGYGFRGHGPEWYLTHSQFAWFAISVPTSLRDRWESLRRPWTSGNATQRDIRPLIEGLMIPPR